MTNVNDINEQSVLALMIEDGNGPDEVLTDLVLVKAYSKAITGHKPSATGVQRVRTACRAIERHAQPQRGHV